MSKPPIVSDLYDDVTGQPTPEFEASEQEEKVKQSLQHMHEIEDMCRTAGWKHVEKWMLDQLEGCKEKLIDESNFKEILRLQAAAKAISNLLGSVDSMCKAAQSEREKPQKP